MEKTWMKALKDSISETFSTMFFVVPEIDEELIEREASTSVKGWYQGCLEVSRGPKSLKIWMWAPERLAGELAANILSSEPEDLGAEDILDAYREMLNMVVGSVLTSVKADTDWTMGLPQAERLAKGTLQDVSAGCGETMTFDCDGLTLVAGMSA